MNLAKYFERSSPGGAFMAIALALTFLLLPSVGMAQTAPAVTPTDFSSLFGDGLGDPYSSILLNQLFGPLFPSANGGNVDTIFSLIVAYFNVIVLVIGGLMFFYNVTVGVLQSAHEGQVLGQRWSSLWAPLRVLFAVGLLIPVPSYGGYNLAQVGIGYIVKGSTNMATAVWNQSASYVIAGDVPIAAPQGSFNSNTLKAMYEQAACIVVLDQQAKIANPNAQIGYFSPRAIANGTPPASATTGADALISGYINRGSMQTAVFNGSSYTSAGICGSWSTPDLPAYIDRVIADAGAGSQEAQQVKSAFLSGHASVMQNVSNRLINLAGSQYGNISNDDVEVPLISDQLAAIHRQANAELYNLNVDIRQRSVQAGGSNTVRDQLLNRITGGSSCVAGGSNTDAENRKDAASCYGEGWMGAGSWYILMARLNNELSTLMAAKGTATEPNYLDESYGLTPHQLHRASGGSGSGLAGVFGIIRDRDLGATPSRDTTLEYIARYNDLFTKSVVPLATLGYAMPTEMVAGLNADTQSSFWEKILPTEKMTGFTRGMMEYFDPGTSGQDPMVGLIDMGHMLINIGMGILLVVAASGFFTGGAAAVAMLPVFSILLAAGATLAFIMPMMPFLYWVLAITGYFLLIAEAIMAVNLWALSHMRMDGDGISGEAGKMGWLLILSLMMTPVLMVFGFLIGMGLFRVGSDLLSAGMFHAASTIMGANPVIWLMGTLAYTVIMVSSYTILLERSFSLVSEFPNRVMKWMGSQIEIGGGENVIRGATAAGALGINKMGNSIEAGVGQKGADGKFVSGSGWGGKSRAAGDWTRGIGKSRGSGSDGS